MATVWMFFVFVVYFISLCHVRIFAKFENVALHKRVYQSSYFSRNHFSQRSASLAVDGVFNRDNFIHTEIDQPYTWWEVDLGKLYFVHEVKIYFREGYKHRRRGVHIYTNTAVNSSNTGHLCGTVTRRRDGSDIHRVVSLSCNEDARYVTVYQGTDNGPYSGTTLNIVEVEVYTCELNVKYGSNCDKLCINRHCVNTNSPCDVQTGKCDTAGCTAGLTGTDCTQSCEVNVKYGSNCDKLCEKRHCVNTHSSCDEQTGKCDTAGCTAGWTGTDCTQECSPGTFGKNCKSRCGNCINKTCDRFSGNCTEGCTAGYTGNHCKKKCDSGSYGSNCSFNCGHCKNKTCDSVTGHCEDGCHAGYLGHLCKEKCRSGKYGLDCNSTCGQCKTETCDFISGNCTGGCKDGYQGLLCKEECGSGTYGLNCNLSCSNCNNKTCNHISGKCISGCIDGFVGDLCMERIVASQDEAVTISVYTISVVAIIVMVAIILFVIIRRHRMSSKESNQVKRNRKRKAENDDHTAEFDFPTGQVPDPKYNSRKSEEDSEVTSTISSPVEEIDEQEAETTASDYYNFSDVQLPESGVLVSELSKVIDNIRKQPGGFDTEFKKLENGFTSPYEESQITENRPKNRFKGYYPYDKNRVVLTMQTDVPHSDYINASHIDSYTEKDYFIAAQAPNKKTLRDFCRMLWEKKCSKIIMLCNLVEDTKVKCEAYWSDEEMKTVGPFTVVVTEKLEKRDFAIRKISLTHRKTGKTKTFQQFHFITWPDHGIPNVHDFIQFLYHVRKSKATLPGPVLVHCSAGIGRTGTYIALDILLDEMEATGEVDVFNVITRLRDQRKGLVQTKEQYEMLFVVLLEMATYGDTSMDNAEFYLKYQQQKTSLVMGKKTIDQLGQEIGLFYETSYIGTPNKYRVWTDGRQDFFATCLPSEVSKRGYLLIPERKGTEESFWKLVIQNDSYSIITLNSQNAVNLIPSKNESVKHGKVTVTTLHQTSVTDEIMENTLQVETHGDNEKREIRHYCIHGWLPTTDSVTLITCLTTISEKLQQKNITTQPITVVYRECEAKNVTTLCIANNILFGTKLDTEVEIFNNIRRFQTILPHVTFTKDDFVFFCNLAFLHLESSSVYANCPTSHN